MYSNNLSFKPGDFSTPSCLHCSKSEWRDYTGTIVESPDTEQTYLGKKRLHCRLGCNRIQLRRYREDLEAIYCECFTPEDRRDYIYPGSAIIYDGKRYTASEASVSIMLGQRY